MKKTTVHSDNTQCSDFISHEYGPKFQVQA